jgi:hypothetical protein
MLKASERMQLADAPNRKKRIIWLASEGWDRNNEQVGIEIEIPI